MACQTLLGFQVLLPMSEALATLYALYRRLENKTTWLAILFINQLLIESYPVRVNSPVFQTMLWLLHVKQDVTSTPGFIYSFNSQSLVTTKVELRLAKTQSKTLPDLWILCKVNQ